MVKIYGYELAQKIDLTLLKPEASRNDIIKLCKNAKKFGFIAVCVNPVWVPLASTLLKNTGVKVCSVVGFPFGANLTEVKTFEAKRVVQMGAKEVDVVINIGALKSKNYDLVKEDLASVVKIALGEGGETVKAILEVGLLTPKERKIACQIVKEAKAHYVKTGTGFHSKVTVRDVKVLRKIVGDSLKIKAAGGVRSYREVLALLDAGADRIGASLGVEIVLESIKVAKAKS